MARGNEPPMETPATAYGEEMTMRTRPRSLSKRRSPHRPATRRRGKRS